MTDTKKQAHLGVTADVTVSDKSAKNVAQDLAPAIAKAVEEGFFKAQVRIRQQFAKTAETLANEQVKANEKAQKRAARERAAQINRGGTYRSAARRAGMTANESQIADMSGVAPDIFATVIQSLRSQADARVDQKRVDEERARTQRKTETDQARAMRVSVARWGRRGALERAAQSNGPPLGDVDQILDNPVLYAEQMYALRQYNNQQAQTAKKRGAQARSINKMQRLHKAGRRVGVTYSDEVARTIASDPVLYAQTIADHENEYADRPKPERKSSRDPAAAAERKRERDAAAAAARAERLAQRRANALFPGIQRLHEGTGLPLGLLRGGMAAASMFAGVASGNPLIGAGGGGWSGLQVGSMMGLGGAGMALAGGIGMGVGALGATGVYGFKRGFGNVGGALGFQSALMPALGVDPLRLRDAGALQNQLSRTALGMHRMLNPQAAAALASGVASGGGWGGTADFFKAFQSGAGLVSSQMGVSNELVGQMEALRRQGGGGISRMGAGAFGPGAVLGLARSGLQGQEIGNALGSFAGLAHQAQALGTQVNLNNMVSTTGQLSGVLGAGQAARLAGSMSSQIMNVAMQGTAGAANPMQGLMMMQAFGGLDLSKRGQSASDILAAQLQMERTGVTGAGLDKLRGSYMKMAGGDSALATLFAQSQIGGPGLTQSWMTGRAATSEIAGTLRSGAASAAALAATGLGSYGAGIVPENLARQQATQALDVQSGLNVAKIATSIDQAGAQIAAFATNLLNLNKVMESMTRSLVVGQP